jgi:uroporphyrinogen III methyltransferase/synthase
MNLREAGPNQTSPKGKVYLVGAGPGDPGLITQRGIECLNQADVVLHDRLINRLLLRYAPRAKWINVGKRPDHHPVPQEQINTILIEQASLGQVVVRLKGGDPFVFGRAGEEALALVEAHIPYEVVPGVTSAVAVPAYAGIPVTQRDVAKSVAFITGHRSNKENGLEILDASALGADTLVFLMGVQNLPVIVKSLIESGRSPDTPVALIEQGTTPFQKTVTGTLKDILQRGAEINPPAVTVVGEVVRLREKLAWFENMADRPLLGLRVINTSSFDSDRHDLFSDRLRLLGAEVKDLPAIQIVSPPDTSDLDGAIQSMINGQKYDWILFTSASAVKFTLQRILDSGYDLRLLAGVRLGAVGDATAQSLWEYHLRTDFVPTRFTALELARQLDDLEGRRILLPRSQIANPELVDALEARGALVDTAVVYSTITVDPDPQTLSAFSDERVDLVTLFSPSAFRGLMEMLEQAFGTERCLNILKNICLACIGPTTASAVEALDLEAEIVANMHTADGLVEAILKWYVH